MKDRGRSPVRVAERGEGRVLVTRPPIERFAVIRHEIESGRYPNKRSLAEKLEVSEKTIQRDLDFARDRLGWPLAYHPQKYGWYATGPLEDLPVLEVTEGELLAVAVGWKAVESFRGTPWEGKLRKAFEKISPMLPDTLSVKLEGVGELISIRNAGVGKIEDAESFAELSRAVAESRVVRFRYRKRDSRVFEKRIVEPYHLTYSQGAWYVLAMDRKRAAQRTFLVGRMKDVEVLEDTFERPADFSAADLLKDSFGIFNDAARPAGRRRSVEVRLQFTGLAARLVSERDWHGSQEIVSKGMGNEVVIKFRLSGTEEIERWILSWGDEVEVLAPMALRRRVADIGRRVTEVNGDGLVR